MLTFILGRGIMSVLEVEMAKMRLTVVKVVEIDIVEDDVIELRSDDYDANTRMELIGDIYADASEYEKVLSEEITTFEVIVAGVTAAKFPA